MPAARPAAPAPARPRAAAGLAVAFAAALAAGPAAEADVVYAVRDLGRPGETSSSANAINATGQVAGTTTFPGGDFGEDEGFVFTPGPGGGTTAGLGRAGGDTAARAVDGLGRAAGFVSANEFAFEAVVFAGGETLRLGTLGGAFSFAEGINDAGQVTGRSDTADGRREAFLYAGTPGAGGAMTGLGFLEGDTSSLGAAINGAGQVAGTSQGAETGEAFLYTGTPGAGGAMTGLGFLDGDTSSLALGINEAGHVAGSSSFFDADTGEFRSRAFLFADGAMTGLGTLGGTTGRAAGLNDAGRVVGTSETADFRSSAFLWDAAGGMRDLNGLIDPDSGWVLEDAFGINDAGFIVGAGRFEGGSRRAFLLAPAAVPEPTTWGLIGLAAACGAGRRRGRRAGQAAASRS